MRQYDAQTLEGVVDRMHGKLELSRGEGNKIVALEKAEMETFEYAGARLEWCWRHPRDDLHVNTR